MNQPSPLSSEVLTEVVAFLSYKQARQLLPVSSRYSRVLVSHINYQLQPILDLCIILEISCSQLDDQIDSIDVQLRLFREQESQLDVQYQQELNRGHPLQQCFLLIFRRQKFLAEIEAIHAHFQPRLTQLSQNSFLLEIQILRLEKKKIRTKMELRKCEHYIRHGEAQPSPIPAKNSTSNSSICFSNLLKLIIALFPILIYVIFSAETQI